MCSTSGWEVKDIEPGKGLWRKQYMRPALKNSVTSISKDKKDPSAQREESVRPLLLVHVLETRASSPGACGLLLDQLSPVQLSNELLGLFPN